MRSRDGDTSYMEARVGLREKVRSNNFLNDFISKILFGEVKFRK